ncbi:MAG: membrane-bound O-acyltransferase family protein [Deltaproteobacteria bacterium]|nr:MAG: membrane-bound O-acyltransferase family protein [Deltaproteobacteria bacterium]
MVFSSPIFLFCFLPVFLSGTLLVPSRMRNAILISLSFFFYFWGEQAYTLLLAASIGVNHLTVMGMKGCDRREGVRTGLLTAGIIANLCVLIFFKYSVFLVSIAATAGNADAAAFARTWLADGGPHLPLGISFITFQSLSLLVDVWKRDAGYPGSVKDTALFLSLFPQLVAGPILRFRYLRPQLDSRRITAEDLYAGACRFIVGLSKKVLVANTLAQGVDGIFTLRMDSLTPLIAWLGAAGFALQIYFDFSGYTDMAIGLGRMAGFRFPENFNRPYRASSIRSFWRRWHMTLSEWFRDYLYIPLGGNRKGRLRTAVHLFIVFSLCGLWHGAGWNFLIWGLCHGLLLVLERVMPPQLGAYVPLCARRLYVLVAVTVLWVFFRLDDTWQAMAYLGVMFGNGTGGFGWRTPLPGWSPECSLAFILAAACSVLPFNTAALRIASLTPVSVVRWSQPVAMMVLCLLVVMKLSVAAYNPFIYFRF